MSVMESVAATVADLAKHHGGKIQPKPHVVEHVTASGVRCAHNLAFGALQVEAAAL